VFGVGAGSASRPLAPERGRVRRGLSLGLIPLNLDFIHGVLYVFIASRLEERLGMGRGKPRAPDTAPSRAAGNGSRGDSSQEVRV